MIVRVRQCCCALTTFVRLVAIFFLVFHVLLALSATVWYLLFSSKDANGKNEDDGVRNVNDRTFDSFLITAADRTVAKEKEANELKQHLDLLIVILLGAFAAIGFCVNIFLLVGVHIQRRSLFIPWLVFQLIVILGNL